MIVPMQKVFIAVRAADRDALLEALAGLGVVHLTPVDPARAIADEETLEAIRTLERAVQVLGERTPARTTPEVAPGEAAREVLDIQRRSAEQKHRLGTLARQIEHLDLWGEARLEQFQALEAAGLKVAFYNVPAADLGGVQAECVQALRDLSGGRVLAAVVTRTAEPQLPESAQPIPLPPRDVPSLRTEAAEIDAALKADADRLDALAGLVAPMRAELRQLEARARFTTARRSGLDAQPLYALQGWVPRDRASDVASGLEAANLPAAVRIQDPGPDEAPPTLIRAPRWTRPIKGLFRILGTVAGYREFDVSVPFMIALPIFAALLFSDAGYGAVLLFTPLLAYRRVTGLMGRDFTHLLMVIGAVTLALGCLTSSFFGFSPYPPLIPVEMTEESRTLLMQISFVIGAIHLSLAQFWQAVRLFPNPQFLNKVGWGTFIWGMLGVVRMFVLNQPLTWSTPWPYLLITGAAGAIVFSRPSRNVFKMLLLGLADFPLAMLSSFSDVISYVRLMAVGLAGSVLAVSFNDLAFKVPFRPLTVLVLIAGHGLNLGLCLIALFAHGVRLNMLEFSNNLGVQWTGYAYEPFSQQTLEENAQ